MIIKVLLTYIISYASFANIVLNFSMVRNIGGDEGFSLKTELHETRRIMLNQNNKFIMKNGMSVDLVALFVESFNNIGPSNEIQLQGAIKNEVGKVIKKVEGSDFLLILGEPKMLSFDSEGKTIDLNLSVKMEKK